MIFELGTKQQLWLTREVFPHRDMCTCVDVCYFECGYELINLNDASSKEEGEFFFSVETNQHHGPNLDARHSIFVSGKAVGRRNYATTTTKTTTSLSSYTYEM